MTTPTSGGPIAGHIPGLMGSYAPPRPSGIGGAGGNGGGGRKPPTVKRSTRKPKKPTATAAKRGKK